jgi:hypothetical protein
MTVVPEQLVDLIKSKRIDLILKFCIAYTVVKMLLLTTKAVLID